jgi:MFS family permease
MNWRNRLGLYGAYFFGMAGIGFVLPFLPKYLKEEGLSNQDISIVWTLAALTSLLQFPIGLWSDRLRWRKPFLLVALALLAGATWLLHGAHGTLWLGLLAILFAENGPCRSVVESLAGAEATHLAPPDGVGAALGALRFWRPIGIIAVALAGVALVGSYSIGSLLLPVAVLQAVAVLAALLIHEWSAPGKAPSSNGQVGSAPQGKGLRDGVLWVFVAAIVLFHASAAPGGAYLGLFMQEDLAAPDRLLPVAFIVMMIVWMLVVWPAGRLADRIGRRPLLILGWGAMAVRLALLGVAREAWQVLALQVLDGLAQGLFAVMAAAWVTDRLADPRRVGEAQVLVGSALVFGSALGPLLAGLVVDTVGYRGMFGLLAGVATVATLIIIVFVPETLRSPRRLEESDVDLSFRARELHAQR